MDMAGVNGRTEQGSAPLTRALLAGAMFVAFAFGWAGSIGGMGPLGIAFHVIATGSLIFAMRLWPSEWQTGRLVVGLAVAGRLLIWPMTPSDDVNRYVWEGRVLRSGANPYLLAPTDPSLLALRDEIWTGINHPDYTAIYGPAATGLFALLGTVGESLAGFKAAMVMADLLALLVLLGLLRHLRLPLQWALFYALHPLVLIAFAGEGHLESWVLLALALALWARTAGNIRSMFLCLAVAGLFKWTALLALPFFLRRDNLRHAWAVVLPLLLGIGLAPGPWPALFDSLHRFVVSEQFNSGIYRMLMLGLPETLVPWVAISLLIVMALWLRLSCPRLPEALLNSFGWLCLLAGTVHYWYLTVLVLLLCLSPQRVWALWTALVATSFMAQISQVETGQWREWALAPWFQYGPLFALMAWDLLRSGRHSSMLWERARAPIQTMTVIVPVLNEAATLGAMLTSVKHAWSRPLDVVAVDGGSTDDTVAVAERAGARVIRSGKGRGNQIVVGVAASTSELIVIAHADMTFPPGLFDHGLAWINRSGAVGGCFGSRFDVSTPLLRLIGPVLNWWRARWLGLSFGDQLQFVRRDALEELGGFPALPLMEDVELALRIREKERPLYLALPVTVSSRSWRVGSPWRRALLIIRIVALYMWRRSSNRPVDVSGLYRSYYPQTGKRPEHESAA